MFINFKFTSWFDSFFENAIQLAEDGVLISQCFVSVHLEKLLIKVE